MVKELRHLLMTTRHQRLNGLNDAIQLAYLTPSEDDIAALIRAYRALDDSIPALADGMLLFIIHATPSGSTLHIESLRHKIEINTWGGYYHRIYVHGMPISIKPGQFRSLDDILTDPW